MYHTCGYIYIYAFLYFSYLQPHYIIGEEYFTHKYRILHIIHINNSVTAEYYKSSCTIEMYHISSIATIISGTTV